MLLEYPLLLFYSPFPTFVSAVKAKEATDETLKKANAVNDLAAAIKDAAISVISL